MCKSAVPVLALEVEFAEGTASDGLKSKPIEVVEMKEFAEGGEMVDIKLELKSVKVVFPSALPVWENQRLENLESLDEKLNCCKEKLSTKSGLQLFIIEFSW